ncbi:cell division protein FtsZ [Parvularcula sp. IMCC14364]|uniref:cell division protein FtsZ n=1 Tax=Parvularcula sp. IMCC14364 TaxID=3067902 RepID=UPI002742781E|nr:cell division protein FtsZ [Parvularcula sp. IMCC14364]
MPLNLSVPTVTELKPRISVIGVGGAGGNAVNNMIESQLEGVEFVVANTDAQAVGLALADHKIQLGTALTQGLGAGSQPEVGQAAAEESLAEVMDLISGSNMLFITAGMGGGTGTGAAPVIAKAARERNILTVGVVTKPFHFEGARRMRIADAGILELQKYVDTLLIIPNQNLFRIADDNTTFADAFAMADEVLHSGVRGITDLMIVPGLINLDFADVRSVMSEMGKAMMGTGEAEGDKRASEAAEAAISNPLLDEVSMKGARGVLINITGGMDMKLFEVDEAANRIRSEVDPDANIIVGSTFSSELEGKMRVSVVATGIDAEQRLVVSNQTAQGTAPVAPPVQQEARPWLGAIAPATTVDVPDLPMSDLSVSDDGDVTIPATHELFTEEPAAPASNVGQARATETGHVPAAASLAATEEATNPVGDVHERIRKLLTEDADEADTGTLRPATEAGNKGLRNPFREEQKSNRSPLNSAVNLLKETFGVDQPATPPARKQQPRRKSEADDLFREERDPDLEIPAFLRRKNGR